MKSIRWKRSAFAGPIRPPPTSRTLGLGRAAGRGRAPGLGCAGRKYERLSQWESPSRPAAKYEGFGGLCRHSGEASNPTRVYPPFDQRYRRDTVSSGGDFIGPQATLSLAIDPPSVDADLRNLTASLEHRLPGGIHARLDYLRRRGKKRTTYASALRTNKLTQGRGFHGATDLT